MTSCMQLGKENDTNETRLKIDGIVIFNKIIYLKVKP